MAFRSGGGMAGGRALHWENGILVAEAVLIALTAEPHLPRPIQPEI
jgi:hypothetical protein